MMLIHGKVQVFNEAATTDTTVVDLSTPPGQQRPSATRSTPQRWRWGTALAVSGAIVVIATMAIVTQPEHKVDTDVVPDGFDVAEAGRIDAFLPRTPMRR